MAISNVERLSPEQIALTSQYLTDIADRYCTSAVSALSLFGRCCVLTLVPSNTPWDALTCEIARLAGDVLCQATSSGLGLDPLPFIEIHLILKKGGREVAELRQLLEQIVPELEAQSPGVRSMGRLRYIASSLSKLGLPIKDVTPSKEAAALLNDDESWINAPAGQLSDMADHLLADDVKLDETDTRILSLISLGELRNYRIDVGCKLLRAALQLGAPCEEVRHGIDFMALQRRRDGRYGFMDRLTEKSEQDADPNLILFLPMTLNAVWLFNLEAICNTRLTARPVASGVT
jgi:hypothetical protein